MEIEWKREKMGLKTAWDDTYHTKILKISWKCDKRGIDRVLGTMTQITQTSFRLMLSGVIWPYERVLSPPT